MASNESVYVADLEAGRMSVFGPDLQFSRSVTDRGLGFAFPFEVIAGGTVVVGADMPTKDRIGYPLHLYSPELHFKRSFGADTPIFRPDQRMHSRRRLAKSSDGGVWAAHVTEYVIDRFDARGVRTLRLVRRVPWFRSHTAPSLSVDPEPKPRIMAISEDGAGRLWVMLLVKDNRWKSAIGWALPSRLGGGRRAAAPIITDEDAYFDTVIEVIDLRTARVLASKRFPQALLFMLGDLYVGTRREARSGAFSIQLWSVTTKGAGWSESR